jgi:hypothetical protein
VEIKVEEGDATIWVSALDGQPINTSSRMLITHLTDLQNTDIRYAEEARQTLQDWGNLPYLVRKGSATLSIRLETPGKYRAWALAPSGKRLAEMPVKTEKDRLVLAVSVSDSNQPGARYLYEIAEK